MPLPYHRKEYREKIGHKPKFMIYPYTSFRFPAYLMDTSLNIFLKITIIIKIALYFFHYIIA